MPIIKTLHSTLSAMHVRLAQARGQEGKPSLSFHQGSMLWKACWCTECVYVCVCVCLPFITSGPCPAGEILFVPIGVVLQVASIFTESIRLTLVQILLQRRGIKV